MCRDWIPQSVPLSVEVISSVTNILSCREDPSVRHRRSEQKLVELDISPFVLLDSSALLYVSGDYIS